MDNLQTGCTFSWTNASGQTINLVLEITQYTSAEAVNTVPFSGVVKDGAGAAVSGKTVYFIDTSQGTWKA